MARSEDFDSLHRGVLLARANSEWGARAAGQAKTLPALALRLPDGRGWRYEVREQTVEITPGCEADTIVELGEADWRGLWNSSEAVNGLVLSGRVDVLAGSVEDFIAWELSLIHI